MNTGNETVDYLSKLDFVGNVIPNNWFNFIKFESGKVDINSILILSEIVYWHRPSVMKDEVTGKFLGYKKRFKSDKLQKNYESLANQFGLTKRQVKDATDRLEEMNLIEKEFRNIKTQYGQPINNVLYFSLNHLELERITFGSNTDLRSNVTYPTPQSMTNTVITTENKTDILKDIIPAKADTIPYETIVEHLNLKAGKQFKHKTDATRKLIKARWNEGNRLDEFKNVIDTMVHNWKDDPKMKDYLQPSTLFGTKFENYLNQEKKQKFTNQQIQTKAWEDDIYGNSTNSYDYGYNQQQLSKPNEQNRQQIILQQP